MPPRVAVTVPDDEIDMDKNPRAYFMLKPSQRHHHRRILESLGLVPGYEDFVAPCVGDTSSTGCGKTPVACAVASVSGCKHVVVIAPPGPKSTWMRNLEIFGIKDRAEYWTYEKIVAAGSKTETEAGLTYKESKTEYLVTDELLQMIEEGVFIIFDEAHKLQNDTSMQTCSAQAILKAIYSAIEENSNNKSRVMFLSASLTDRPEMAHVWLTNMGIMTENKPWSGGKGGHDYNHDGLRSIRDWVTQKGNYLDISDDDYNDLLDDLNEAIETTGKTLKDVSKAICDKIFEHVICDKFIHTMPNIKTKKNLSYTLELEDFVAPDLQAQFDILMDEKDRLDRLEAKGAINGSEHNESVLVIVKKVEELKVPVFALVALYLLDKDPNWKLVIQFNYVDCIDKFKEELRKKKLLSKTCFIVGSDNGRSTTPLQREKERVKFQRHDNDYRIMVLSKVGTASIDLDDQSPDGSHPRIMLIPSSYFLKDIIQVLGRIYRASSTSDSVSILVLYNRKERSLRRVTEKIEFLLKSSRQGSLPITEKTPFVRFTDKEGGKCEMFLVDAHGNETVIMNDLNIAEFDEEAYEHYRKSNPINLENAKIPRSTKAYSVHVNYKKKNSKFMKRDVLTIMTDLEVEGLVLQGLEDHEMLEVVNKFYDLNDIKRVASKFVKIEEIDIDEDIEPDFFYPGWREPMEEEEEEE